ncbi:MAG TPA: hypothetical protein VH063_12635 [Gaiellaceae bacterium]|nr:hypothetical protein [Gaiellaceae bacterium]
MVAYAIGGAIFARMVAGHLAWKWKSQFEARPQFWDWLAGGCVGILVSWLWLPALLSRRLPRMRIPAIGAERKAQELERERAEQDRLEQAQKRIAELERDTGVG